GFSFGAASSAVPAQSAAPVSAFAPAATPAAFAPAATHVAATPTAATHNAATPTAATPTVATPTSVAPAQEEAPAVPPHVPAQPAAPAVEVSAPAPSAEAARTASDSVRVAAGKVYDLLDVVGEADLGARRVEQTTVSLLAIAAEQARWVVGLKAATNRLSIVLPPEIELALHRVVGSGEQMSGAVRGLRELVEVQRGGMGQVRAGAMGLAMVPVRRVLAALPRIVRDVAQSTGKDVELVLEGEDVELDKQVLDGVADALKHLVINAVDHGCQTPEQRLAMGKPTRCRVTVSARSVGGTVTIEVSDDGAGVDEDAVRRKAASLGMIPADSTIAGPALLQLLFVPAFSTASTVTKTSGRGVGLDVVSSAVEDLGGSVEVRSEVNEGSSFVLTLPVTLGVLRCLVARIGEERYAIPVPAVVESLSLRDTEIHQIAGAPVVLRHGISVPLLDLGAALGAGSPDAPRAALLVRHASTLVAWAVDRLEGESELVVKDLGSFLGRVPHIAGATIDGDGSVVCLLDLRELAERAVGIVSLPAAAAPGRDGPVQRKPRILVVEDSVGVRELERVILEGAGYQVETAVDGLDGAARLRDDPADLVLSDVEMPGMDGFALTRTIRRTKGWENVPVIIMTSRGEDTARAAGLDAGCSAYLLKNEFDQDQLVSTVRRLVGR
ncbi:MAG: CheA signal transduction histidine kinase, partial [Frankiales bacterium]|nr:CheA signal transduction histidine kinase [Frankiales bacterium]